MSDDRRVLDAEPAASLDDHRRRGGGQGLEAARRLGPAGVIDDIEASGLRGRGGAGFVTGLKWRTVAENLSPSVRATVVINGAEGEPGSFKDRAILRRNPYRVLEGALVATTAVGADRLVVALKASFHQEVARVRAALEELAAAGWTDGVDVSIVEGPGEYLYGEETALLEVIDGRHPFPRIAPPYRHGVEEVGPDTASAAQVTMAGPEGSVAPPTLVNNVETFANVPRILVEGPDWFRSVGTAESPGTIVCTVSGATRQHGVAEFPMGVPLRQVVDAIGGGPHAGRHHVAAMSGVANPLVPESLFDTPLTYETMQGIDSGLGAAGFIVFDDQDDLVSVAQGVSRFLAVESCGQCTPCKQDGLAIAGLLETIRDSEAEEEALATAEDHLRTVADESRCYLAEQHQRVVGSIFRLFPDQLRAHATKSVPGAEPALVAAIVDMVDDRAVLDEEHLTKQPDWTHGDTWSGQSPADSTDQRLPDAT